MDNYSTVSSSETAVVRGFAGFISYIFHPLFITTYVALFLLYIHPYAFAGFSPKERLMRLLTVIVSSLFLPAFSLFLSRQLGFISSIYMRTQRDRIIPYIICMIFYFWVWYVFKNLGNSPLAIKEFLLGTFLAICGAWMANIRFKISMHGTAVGGLFMFFLLQSFHDPMITGVHVSISLLIAGLVCTARLIMGGHTRFEVYSGLFVGALAQVVAVWFS